MNDLHLRRKDFDLEWYSGSGAGGQHRNKHQNCCRITHKESGLTARGTSSRSRVENQRSAFAALTAKLLARMRLAAARRTDGETIRTYHAVRNDVRDHRSGKHKRWDEVIKGDGLGAMIEARRSSIPATGY